jgi:methionyl-tRNA formyltransferase
MRVVFAGTPCFAVPALEALAERHEVVAVLTRPDRPAGRGLKQGSSAVKNAATKQGLTVLQPPTLKDYATHAELRVLAPESIVVAAYGLILPQSVLEIPRHGALNIHASLLPRWRGAAPIQRALLAGDRETGVCIMRMNATLDTGPLLQCEALPILPDDTAGTLHDKLASLGAKLIISALEGVQSGVLSACPQPAQGVTYANKIEKSETHIDWDREAAMIERQVRAFNPIPGATACIGTSEIKIWRARLVNALPSLPGTVLSIEPDGVTVACRDGALKLGELQRQGGKRLIAAEFLRGFPLAPGDRFDSRRR